MTRAERGSPRQWMCAICVLCGLKLDAVTWLRDVPVCMDHADVLAREGLLRAGDIARKDLGRGEEEKPCPQG